MSENSKAVYISVSPTCKACLLKREFIDSEKGEITLSNSEYETLNYIIEKDGEPVSRDEILEEIKKVAIDAEDNKVPFYNSVDKTISDIRKKIIKIYVKTVRGCGYKWAPPKVLSAAIPLNQNKMRPAGFRRCSSMTPQEAAEEVQRSLRKFEETEDEDEATKIIRTIMRVMDRLPDTAYKDLWKYFEEYENYLQEIGQAETVKELLCCLMFLKFQRESYIRRLLEYQQALQSSRNKDTEDKLQKAIFEMKDSLFEIEMDLENHKRMVREMVPTQGRFL